ncbi:MAG: PorV/PorQ family protein [Elusimicrobiota bacterium]
MKRFLLIIFFVGFYSNVFASSISGGTLLKQFVGGRASSMGEAFVAISDDLYGLHYNPAGMVNLKRDFTATYFQEPDIGFNYGLFGYGQSFKKLGVLAGSVYMYDAGTIDWEDENGNASKLNVQRDYLFTFGYSKEILEDFSVGINTKLFSSTIIEKYHATAYGMDIGGFYSTPINGLTTGIVMQNIGTPIKYIKKADPMPTTFRAGIAYRLSMPRKSKLTVDLDVVKPNDSDTKENVGFDYWVNDLLSVRGGYKFGYDLESYSLGFGIKLSAIQIDYGIVSRKDLGFLHVVSVSLGEPIKKDRKKTSSADVTTAALEYVDIVVPPPEKTRKEKIKFLLDNVDDLCKKGLYLDALKKVNELLEMDSTDSNWQKLEIQLKKIAEIIPFDIESGKVHDLVRKSISAYLGKEQDGRIAVLAICYAWQTEPENKIVIEVLQFMKREYPSMAKEEMATEKETIVDQKLDWALDYTHNGEHRKAIAECEDILVLEPDNDLAFKMAGSAYFALGNKTMARKMWQRARRVNPKDPEINGLLREVK